MGRVGGLALSLWALLITAGCGPGAEESARFVERVETRHGEPYRLRSVLRPGRTTLGDPVQWTLEVGVSRRMQHVAVRVPPADSALQIVSPSRWPNVAREGERGVWRSGWTVRAFDLGPRPLPAASVIVHMGVRSDTLFFPADTLFVDSVTAAARGRIDPDRGPLPTELRPVDIAVAVAAGVVLAALVAAAIWALRRRPASVAPAAAPRSPPEPAAARYERALAALRADAGSLTRDAFYERLSAAVRDYVAAATGIPATERTTTELDQALRGHGPVTPETRAMIARLLGWADLAKFARAEEEAAAAAAALAEAQMLAGRLEPLPER